MRPIVHSRHQAMLDGIDMNIIDMAREIVFVANSVLFDQTPTGGEIRIAFRQHPDGVEVIRQDNDCFDRERMARPRLAKRSAQFVDMCRQQ